MNPNTNENQYEESQEFQALWRGCAAPDGDWAPLVQRVEPALRCTLAGLGRSYGLRLTRDLVDEVIQETYVRLLQNDRRVLRGCKGRTESTIMSYLRRVARSALVDWLRARRALKRDPASELSIDVPELLADESDRLELPRAAANPFNDIYVRELRYRFRRECWCVASERPTGLRDTWITERMVVDGWSSHEAASVVELAPATVATVISRMRRELRRRGLEVPGRLNSRA
jgi:DNA-directed RNA polymerase specialized sigma24 family protein